MPKCCKLIPVKYRKIDELLKLRGREVTKKRYKSSLKIEINIKDHSLQFTRNWTFNNGREAYRIPTFCSYIVPMVLNIWRPT